MATAGDRGRRAAMGVVLLALLVLVPLVVAMWPQQSASSDADRSYVRASLVEVVYEDCESVTEEVPCGEAKAVLDGSDEVVDALLYRDAFRGGVDAGEAVVLYASAGSGDGPVYSFHSRERTTAMSLFLLVALVLVGVVVRGRGLRAVLSLVGAGAFIWAFLVGGVVEGGSPLAYAAVTAALLLTAVLFFTHGLSAKTLAAWAGTVTGVGSALLLGWWMSSALGLGAGQGTESQLSRVAPGIDLSVLALAGLVLVLIGVLNDIAAAQSATVFSHAGQSDESMAAVLSVGRDHAASAIYTVVFSIVGAGLSGFVLAGALGVPATVLLQSDEVATMVVQAVTGIVGTVVAMPATTFFARALARRFGAGATTAHVH